MNFMKTPRLVKNLLPSLVWDMNHRQQKTIYLTFDDGPVPEVTPFVLETLAAYRAQATFFCVGENIARFPDIFQQLHAAGHSVGNHTYHHLNGWKTTASAYLEDVAQCEAVMTAQEKTLQDDHLFRPPYGRISPWQLRQLRSKYRIIMWDILSGDFDQGFPAELCLKKSIEHSRSGTIIIFHDSYKAAPNLQYVLPRYLEHFASADYEFALI